MPEQVRVFISHHPSPQEDAFTARLKADLEAAGADVWVDGERTVSDDFAKQIHEGSARRQWLLLVMTPAALASVKVQREVVAALNARTTGRMLGVLLVMMQPCREQGIPPFWQMVHRYDATRDYPGMCARLVRDLGLAQQGLGAPGASAAASAAAPPVQASPAQAAPLTAMLPIEHFPTRLAQLGYVGGHTPKGVEVIVPPLCQVAAGPFLMGSDPQRHRFAPRAVQPQHGVTLPAYQMARFPVTVAEYACFVRGGHAEPKSTAWGVTASGGSRERSTWDQQLMNLDHPVVNVSWYDARAYAAWLTQQSGQPWRLPSEAEWEKAARGTDGCIYPWGDTFDQARANTCGSHNNLTTRVGTYPDGASPCGAQDMAGNVWEWTSSLFQLYPYRSDDGREAPDSAGDRVARGGSWLDEAEDARTDSRSRRRPDDAESDLGFRLVCSPPARPTGRQPGW